tara:strand:- start:7861 stop:8235 length:375 start_codon:yes stop_codon:yes gene_type:complete
MSNWQKVIPFIPIEPGVPVIPVVAGCGDKSVIALGSGRGGYTITVMTPKDGPMTTKGTNWRVDLDNPLGFMYALMWLYGECSSDCYWKPLFDGRVDVMCGDYNDKDISKLARAMRKAAKNMEAK